jgi:hypothetical protein
LIQLILIARLTICLVFITKYLQNTWHEALFLLQVSEKDFKIAHTVESTSGTTESKSFVIIAVEKPAWDENPVVQLLRAVNVLCFAKPLESAPLIQPLW